MEYIVSARKYRPTTFQSVVGQSNITTTLKNAIKNNQLAHAYLFCGPRGVGKTTCARIFAKTINCSNITPDHEACNECESCQAFNENRSYNIHELDAASNNSVEDIRNLTDKVRVPPQMGNYSVYIIDEVHMLSQAAFNAFLKTLEEPPKHAIFILATTEKHKIIPTILSRCQIFDFNRISVEDAVEHLKYVAKSEGVSAEEEALNVIAQKADGAMRDALSIFDQVVAFSGKDITYDQVIENLNVLDYDYYFKVTDALLSEDHKQALLIFDEILGKGFDAQHFISGLASHFRDLLVCQDQATIKLMEVGASVRQKYAGQAARCSVDFLYEALETASECDFQYRLAKNKRLHVEFALIKMSRILTKKKTPGNVVTAQEKQSLETDRDKRGGAGSKVPAGTSGTSKTKNTEPSSDASAKKEKPKSISLKNLSREGEEDYVRKKSETQNKTGEDTAEKDRLRNTPFSPDDLSSAWSEYLGSIEKSEPRLYSVLFNHPPQLKENSVIEISVLTTQKAEVEKGKTMLVNFLKEQLRNDLFSLKIEVVKQEENHKKAFTSAEKLKLMIEKNPALGEMKKKLGLDLD